VIPRGSHAYPWSQLVHGAPGYLPILTFCELSASREEGRFVFVYAASVVVGFFQRSAAKQLVIAYPTLATTAYAPEHPSEGVRS